MHYLTVILILFSTKNVFGDSEADLKMLAEADPEYGVTWMFLPDGDGNPQIAYLKLPKGEKMGRDGMEMRSDDGPIYYYLYRKNSVNNPKRFKMDDGSHVAVLANNDNYDPSKETKIIIHGWKNTYRSDVGQKTKNAYLAKSDYNVFVVDWSSMADDNFYVRSAQSTRTVGGRTALLIDYLVQDRSTNMRNIHVIGHSLGAQTAGFTGMSTKSGKLPRITGLDPAKPLFTDNDPNTRLDPSDAEFVDVIHTCAGLVGSDDSLGTVDFWPNGGRMNQPGCNEFTGACSHGRSYEYFAESISPKKSFQAYPCSDYSEFRKGRCLTNPTPMGDDTPNTVKGSYFLMTRANFPFAMNF